MNNINAWIAKAEIAELITSYAALIDAGEWNAVGALYTESGRMSRPTAPENYITGREAILAAFYARPRRISRHIVVNILVTLQDEKKAHATSQLLLYMGNPPYDNQLPVVSGPPLVGTYNDILHHTGDGWRFVERRGSLDFQP